MSRTRCSVLYGARQSRDLPAGGWARISNATICAALHPGHDTRNKVRKILPDPCNFRCRGGNLAIEESLWIDGRGQPHRIGQLAVVGEISALGGEIGWQFRRTS